MNQCLRCSKPCAATSVFCDECRALLRTLLQQGSSSMPAIASSLVSLSSSRAEESDLYVSAKPLERITSPSPVVQTPPLTTPRQYPYSDLVEEAVHRLNEAAHLIAEVEQNQRRVPRASRLTPMRDISAEIRRESTPLPRAPRVPESDQGADLEKRMPDLWPWLQDNDVEESDSWDSSTDPLMARHFPDSAESARIEEEDVQRAIASGLITGPMLLSRSRQNRIRIIFMALAILAVVALAIDGVLASVIFVHPHHQTNIQGGPPTLTLSSAVAEIGQTVILHIRHFSPVALVSLTRDVQDPIQTNTGSPFVKVDANGAADMPMLVETSWGPGPHTIVAEDFTTRYTASIILQIVRSGTTRPSHLLVDTHQLDMGSDLEGANTIQSLTLINGGGGTISWTASSNQPWLMLAPLQGMFSTSQAVSVAIDRVNLKPGDYRGMLTFSSNQGTVEHVEVDMSVRPLPMHAGAVLAVTPPVLSFTALDGASDPSVQLLTISNPGTEVLHWALANNTVVAATPTPEVNWLSTDRTAGNVVPGATDYIRVSVNSQIMLPGTYTNTLLLTGNNNTVNSPQNINISLTVEPRCALTLNAWNLSFTAVVGQSNPTSQSVNLNATSSCTGTVNWHATSSVSWLTVTPSSGQVKTATSALPVVSVNASGLGPGVYSGNISFLTGESTQTLAVQLTVQAPPSPSAPIMGVLPLTLNFSTTQGMSNPAQQSQIVTITNNGGSQLNWHTSVNTLASSWLNAAPSGGTIAPGKTGQLTVRVNTTGLMPGTYTGQIVLNGMDGNGFSSGGSPQTVAVNLLVLPPCTLAQPSSSSVAFSATQGSSDPTPQPITITGSGNCGWPLSWKANVTSTAPWLKLTPASGLLQSVGQSATMNVAASIAGLNPGTYSAQVSLTATDGSGSQAKGSPQIFSVTLTVLQPCTLTLSASSLTFTAKQGQSTSAQNVTISQISTCARPVSWSIAGDAGSVNWLVLSPSTGTDTGTVSVNVNTLTLLPGTYTGYITATASGSGGATVQGSPQTIPVKLTVTGFSVTGIVYACADSTCSSPIALPGATLALTGTSLPGATTDAAGTFSFSNLPLGTYTVNVSGTDSLGTHYVGTATITVNGKLSGVTINVYPG